jgi:hypothetical protein
MKNFVIILNIAMFFNWLIFMMVAFMVTPKSLGFEIWGLSAVTCLLVQLGWVILDAMKDEGYAD